MNPKAKREQSQDKLGTMPIGKLLVTMSVPMMISMFIQALYNVVDSMFVARLSEDALTAVSLAFPIQNIMIALAVGTGVGVNALVSRSLGEGNLRRAEKAANVQIFLDVTCAGFFAAVCDSALGSGVQVKYRCPVCGTLTEKPVHCGVPGAAEKGVRWMTNDAVNLCTSLLGALAALGLFALHS